MTGVLSGSAAIVMILLENHGVLPLTMYTFRAFAEYSCPGKDKHPYCITSHALGSIRREPRATPGHSPMLFTRHGEIANRRFKEVSSPARLGILEN